MTSTEYTVIKKDGTKELWNARKIISAIQKAATRCCSDISADAAEGVADLVLKRLSKQPNALLSTYDIHPRVIEALNLSGFSDIAASYQEYRDYKNTYASEFEKIKHDADSVLQLGDRENANFDSSLISTKGSLIKGYLTKSLYKQFYLSKEEKMLSKRGDIYIHDLRDMILGSINCCLIDTKTILKNGFEMSNIKYTEPKSVLAALQVIGDITLVASAQQFGGFTIPELDKVLLPYCKKTYNRAYDEYMSFTEELDAEDKHDVRKASADKYANSIVEKELRQGFQSLELKLNTVPSSRGDFAFTTITFGQWDPELLEKDRIFLYKIGKTILDTRKAGHGGKQVVFPKLVYLYDKDYIEQDKYSGMLFKESVECSSQCMYPDYLSLTGDSEHNKVAQVYLESGKKVITSPMG